MKDCKCGHKKMLYMAGNLLYVTGWVVTLIGLALVQDDCKDLIVASGFFGKDGIELIPFLIFPVGDDCEKGFRFPWFVWALSSIPALLAAAATLAPERARGASTSFFAVIAPLSILMANTFYSAVRFTVAGMQKNMQVSTAGFSILSGASLLMLLLDSILAADSGKGAVTVQHAAAEAAKPAEPV
eukprot:jgi/Ulvmu1/3251/UM150_0024.1